MQKGWKKCAKCGKKYPPQWYRVRRNGAGIQNISADCKNCDRVNFSTRILLKYVGNRAAHKGEYVSIDVDQVTSMRLVKLPPATCQGADIDEFIMPDWRKLGGSKI